MKSSGKAEEALRRIRALRKLPKSATTQRAETKIFDNLSLQEVSDVALALASAEEEEARQ
jgi:hypothetical protein